MRECSFFVVEGRRFDHTNNLLCLALRRPPLCGKSQSV